jgi:hypothetical protein
VVTGECEELALRIGLLPHHEFPRLPGGNPGAYVKHVLRSGDSETRIDELRACGCWMLDHARPRLEP